MPSDKQICSRLVFDFSLKGSDVSQLPMAYLKKMYPTEWMKALDSENISILFNAMEDKLWEKN
jgi:hypothetical protein